MRARSEAGQAMALTAVALVVLLGFTGLAVDMGVLRYDQRLQQTAADAAAIAGAKELRYDSSGVVAAGQNAAAANGFTDNGGGLVSKCDNRKNPPSVYTVCVQINHPPTWGGPHDGDPNYVEALVAEVHPTYFMRIFGVKSEPVMTRAVATLQGQTNSYAGCIYTLGPPGTGVGVTSSGTPTVNAGSCGIYDNGNWTVNGAPVNITAAGIGVSGSGTNNGGGTVTCTDTDYSCPETGLLPQSDPLKYLQESTNTPTAGTATTFDPSNPIAGTYSSIDINGGTVKFGSGTYVVEGNFTINGNSFVTGSDVTFYITNGGAVSIAGTSTVQLSAPSTGPYAGILFYQDPSDTSTAKILGTNDSWYQGSLYFPSAQLEFGGTNTTCSGSLDPSCSTSTVYNSGAAYTNIVADDLKFFGTATIDINSDYSSLPGGTNIIENAVLVE